MSFPTRTVELDLVDNPGAAYAEATLMLKPAIYWRCNTSPANGSVVPDAGGNLRDGLVNVSSVAAPTSVAGGLANDPAATAFQFPGGTTGGGGNCSNIVVFTQSWLSTFSLTTDWTFECWFKLTGTLAHEAPLWQFYDFSNGHGQYLFVSGVDRKLYFANGNYAARTVVGPFTGAIAADGTWHHLVFAANGGSTYLDGALVGNSSTVAGPSSNKFIAIATAYGWLGPTTGAVLDGAIQEIAIYQRTLKPTEVAAHFATAQNTAPAPGFTVDASQYFFSGSTKRGRQFELDTIQAGAAGALFDNTDRTLDPTNSDGPNYGSLRPLRRLRKRWTYNGVTYTRFVGLIERFPLSWELSDAHIGLTAVDAFEQLARADISDRSFPATAELSGSRIDAVLDACLWPKTLRTIDAGVAQVGPTAFDQAGGQSALSYIQQIADNELGYFFIAADGTATFHDRHHRDNNARSNTSQATFGDQPGQLPYEAPDLVLDYSYDRILNNVTTTCAGGTPQQVIDADSRANYLDRSLTRTTIGTTDADALVQSQLLVARYSEPAVRIEQIVLRPSAVGGSDGDALWEQVLGAEIGDRVTVCKTPDTGPQIQVDCYIEAMEDVYTETSWQATWQLSPASGAAVPPPLGERYPTLIQKPFYPVGLPI